MTFLHSLWDTFRRWDWGVAAIAVVILFIGFVGYRTSSNQHPPIIDDQGYALAYRNVESTTVEYDRSFRVLKSFDGTVYRSIECDRNQRAYDVPPVTRQFTAGIHRTSRAFAVDYKYLPDSECVMRTWVEFQPLGSVRHHIYEVRPIPFKVLRGKDD